MWRHTGGQSWRVVVVVDLAGGLLEAVALGAIAGAQRTGSAYSRYLQSIKASRIARKPRRSRVSIAPVR